MSGAWYDVAFDAFYADLYAHRNEAEAERAVSWLAGELLAAGAGALAGKTVLDLACGAGRHVRALARRRARVVGIDRSWPLLEKARASRGEAIERQQLVAGDLRALPFADRSFDIALSMFTSLGYFEEDAENRAVLAEAGRVLKPGGHFIVDYLNAEVVASTLVPASSRLIGGYRVDEKRRIDGERGRIIKEVVVSRHPGGERVKRYVESVALWSRSELVARLGAADFVVRTEAGDYDGQAFGTASPRLILWTKLGR